MWICFRSLRNVIIYRFIFLFFDMIASLAGAYCGHGGGVWLTDHLRRNRHDTALTWKCRVTPFVRWIEVG